MFRHAIMGTYVLHEHTFSCQAGKYLFRRREACDPQWPRRPMPYWQRTEALSADAALQRPDVDVESWSGTLMTAALSLSKPNLKASVGQSGGSTTT
jgi:hypothetical protein